MNNAIKYVPLSCLNSSGFSNKDLAVHNKLVIKVSEYPSGTKFSQEPWRYLDFPYIGDDIVPIGEIKFGGSDASAGNSIANYQSVRSANNPKLKEIRNSIEQHGYDLKAIPIAVYEYKDKDGVHYELLDGRTRYHILKEFGVNNIIVDKFNIPDKDQRLIFGSQCNTSTLETGISTKEDHLNVIRNLINMDSIIVQLPFAIKNIAKKGKVNIDSRRKQIADVLDAALNHITLNNITSSDRDWVTNTIIEEEQKDPLVLNFKNGNGINDHIQVKLGINLKDVYRSYVVTGVGAEGKTGGLFQIVLDRLKANPTFPVDVILYCGSPGNKNPEEKWLRATQKFIGEFDQYVEDVCQYMFNGNKMDGSKIRFLGAVPQLQSLSDKFPMNRLVTKEDFIREGFPIAETLQAKAARELEEENQRISFEKLAAQFREQQTNQAA